MTIVSILKKTLGVSAVSILLSGCATMPALFSPPPLKAEIPENWIAEHNQGEVSGAWWQEFNDPILNAFINEAILSNHDLAAAAARIETAQAEARVAGADLYPQIQGGTNAARSKQVTALGDTISNSYGVSLDVSWELDVWGRIRSGTSAAISDLQAQEAEYAAAALSLAAQTSKAWFAVVEAQSQLNLANETVESFRKTAKQAANRVDAGVQSPTDKYLTEANVSSAEALVQQRTETLKRSVRQLEILLGRYPAGQIDSASALPSVPALPDTGIPSELISRRPDLMAAERRLAAADKRIDASKAALLPRLSLTGSTGTMSDQFGDLLDGNFLGWTIASNLIQPLFQGGRLRAQIKGAEGRAQEAAERYAQLALSAFGEIETSLSVDENLRLREDAQKRTAAAAGEAARIANNRYGQGIETLLSVLEGQRRQLDAQGAVLSAHRQRLENRVDLYLALGGGFENLQIADEGQTP